MANGQTLVRGAETYTAANNNQVDPPVLTFTSTTTKFIINSGDRYVYELPSEQKERNELGGSTAWAFDTDIWVAYSMKVDGPLLTSDWMIVGQFRATDDAADISFRAPPFAITLYPNDEIVINTRSDPTDPSTIQPDFINRYTGNFVRGVWEHYVHKIRFSRAGNGALSSWINGVQVVNEASIPVGYNDALGPKWRFGIYREPAVETVEIQYANMELGLVDLSARILNPLPT